MRRIIVALRQLDTLSQLCLACLVLGWFFTDTLVASWGALQHGVRFFQMSVVLRDPSMVFFRIPVSLAVLQFAALCAACIAAPLLPRLLARPWLAAAHFAPLALLLICAWLLYQRTAGDFLPAPPGADGVAAKVVGLANRLLNKGSATVSHHIAVGVGGYLGLLASVALAVQGLRQLKAALRSTAPIAPGRSAAGAARRRP